MDHGSKSQKALQVNTPGRTEKETRLRDTRHLSSFHVYQPCRDGVTTRLELTSYTSNAEEFEEASYPVRALVGRPEQQRWGTS